MLSPDYRDLLAEFNAHQVDFMLVGAHALAVHGHVRGTKDLDVWVRTDKENARRVMEALRSYGAPLHDLTEEDLSTPGIIFQVGAYEVRVDVLTVIDGVDFDEAWEERVPATLANQSVHVLSRKHLLQNKRASGRKQDLADVEALEELQ